MGIVLPLRCDSIAPLQQLAVLFGELDNWLLVTKLMVG